MQKVAMLNIIFVSTYDFVNVLASVCLLDDNFKNKRGRRVHLEFWVIQKLGE